MNITILGEYITNFGELWDKSLIELFEEAITGVIKNSNLDPSEIDAIYVANMGAGILENQLHLGALVSSLLPHHPPSMRIEAACASGGLATVVAQQALFSGRYQTVLVIGAEKMTDVSSSAATEFLTSAADVNREYGSTFPILYSLLTLAHMQKFSTTREMLSGVSSKNHTHALSNPHAQFHKIFSIQDIGRSEVIADPIRLLDCSPVSDGAAAVILTTRVNNGPKILGFGHACDSLTLADRHSLTQLDATVSAAKQAYDSAHLTPQDIKMAEVHDCFTIGEILAIEDLGFFSKGQGGPATLKMDTTYKGKIIINPSGGLKACGHPVGATGIKQIAFISDQIRQQAIDIGLTQNIGGSGATAVVHIIGGRQ